MKKFLCAILLIFVFVMGGCSYNKTLPTNAITLGLSIEQSGEIKWQMFFPLNSESLKNAGSTSEEIKNFGKLLTANLLVMKSNFDNKNTDEIGANISDVLFDTKHDSIGIVIKFRNSDSYSKFFGSSSGEGDDKENENSNIRYEKSLFTTKVFREQEFPFSQSSAESFINKYKEIFDNFAKNCYEDDNVKYALVKSSYQTPYLVYKYGTYYNRLHSNADVRYDADNMYYHCFSQSFEEICNGNVDKIEYYTTSANSGWWYVFALVGVLAVSGSTYLVIKLIRKKQNKKLS